MKQIQDHLLESPELGKSKHLQLMRQVQTTMRQVKCFLYVRMMVDNIEITVENENEENMDELDADEVVQRRTTSGQNKKRKMVETLTEHLARNHDKCLRILAQSNDNLPQATYTRAKLKHSAVFSLTS
ncbi:hypothetical protein JTB14_017555 [Gonioctena quinquepunctata]|nr:hypothetical protein JTB14_017555 [Gonioctena quinquepunctata]